MSEITLFLSCVSEEFLHEDPGHDHCFHSWGKMLEKTLNKLGRDEVEVVTQETVRETESGDLLENLEKAVKRSDYVIHLYGDFPGRSVDERSLRLLREKSPDFLSDEPEMLGLLPDWSEISYTQWELYFAWQHNSHKPLIYCADEEAPRSPVVRERELKPEEKACQEKHREVIEASGQLCPVVCNQDHFTRLVQTFLTKEGEFEQGGYKVSRDEVIAKAKGGLGNLVREVGKKLGVGVRDRVLGTLLRKGKDRLKTIEAVARKAGISARELMEIIETHISEKGSEAEVSFDSCYELAFSSLIIGEYAKARVYARSAADLALKGRVKSKTKQGRIARDKALHAFVLLHDLAVLDDKLDIAAGALQEGSQYWEKEESLLGWADYHFQLAEYLFDMGYSGDADRLLWGIEGTTEAGDEDGVLDIYEEHFGKENPEEETELKLARAVHLTARVKNFRGEFKLAKDLAGRAGRIYENYGPLAAQSVADCLLNEGSACESQGELEESVELGQAALDILEKHGSMDPGNMAYQKALGVGLNKVGRVREKQGKLEEALEVSERSVEIFEDLASKEPGNLAYRCNLVIGLSNLGRVHEKQGEPEAARVLLGRSLEMFEDLVRQKPENLDYRSGLGVGLGKLGRLHLKLGELEAALAVFERSLEIAEDLVSKEPGNLVYRRNRGVGLKYLGRVREKQGNLAVALEDFKKSLEIAEDFVSKEPDNLAHLRDHGIALAHCASIRIALGEQENAGNLLRVASECFRTVLDREAGYGDVASRLDLAEELLASVRVEDRE